MSALSSVFLWLLPLAFLPVIIHLLNRLRYRTVKWAAMMFLRSADRDASRRAKIRQWIILAARCLMLAAFLLALARLQSRGRLARFFDSGANMVVIVFDRSPGMELQRGGGSGRERALGIIQQGLDELGANTRVVWVDSATGTATPLPRGVDIARLPLAAASSVPADMTSLLRTALREVAQAGVPDAEIWIPSDRRAPTWLPPGAATPDWEEWEAMNAEVSIRLLDIAQIPPDPGNRTLQLLAPPRREGDRVLLEMRMLRDIPDPETVPLRVEAGGLSLTENLMVEGYSFRWVQELEIDTTDEDVHAFFSLPADTNNQDNEVAVSWRPSGPRLVRVDVEDPWSARAVRAAVLPRRGLREVVDGMAPLSRETSLWVRDTARAFRDEERAWIEGGGVVLQLPDQERAGRPPYVEDGLGVPEWMDQTGVLGPDIDGSPLRLDLVRVFQRIELPEGEGIQVLARLEDGAALFTREDLGAGMVIRMATLPGARWSNLDAGYVWVPLVQRLLSEGQLRESRWGTHRLGDWRPRDGDEWQPLDGEDRVPQLNTGRFVQRGDVVALNRDISRDGTEALSLEEIREWAGPLDLRVYEDHSARGAAGDRRVELTQLLALLGLLFLVVESWLLTLNIRRPMKHHRPAWSVPA